MGFLAEGVGLGSGGVVGAEGCGLCWWVACEGGLLVEWGRTVLGWVGSASPPTVRFWDDALGRERQGCAGYLS